MRTLFAASARHLLQHPAQLALALLGLALGVGTVTAVDVATASAARAFELSMDAANGAATHQILGGAQGIDERIYVALRKQRVGVEVAPLVEGYVVVGGRSLQLLGIDPLADERVRGGPTGVDAAGRGGAAVRWFSEPGTVVLTRRTATQLGLVPGAGFELMLDGQTHHATLLSVLDDSAGPGFDGLMLTDIAQAQEWLGLPGRLSRIDVRALANAGGAAAVERLRKQLPAGLKLEETRRRARESLDMSRAFTINLKAMGLLALLVGVFLIYSAVSFAIVQRRRIFGVLRAIGATRANLFTVVLIEALGLGLIGTAIGTALGLAIGRELVALVSRTINDLYFVVAVNEVALPPGTWVKAIVGGLCVTLVAAALPLAEVAGTVPQLGLRRSTLERRYTRASQWLALASLVLLVAAAVSILVSERSLLAGFAALLLLLLAVAAVAPAALHLVARFAARRFARFSSIGRIALAGIAESLSRTGVAVAALAMAIAATIGVAIMVGSFRESLRGWLERSLHADFYVSAPGPGFARPERRLEPTAITALLAVDGIVDHSAGRRVTVESERGPIVLDAVSFARSKGPSYELIGGDPPAVWRQLAAGALVISEPLAWRLSLGPGDRLSLLTPQGPRDFRIAGIYREFGNDRGNSLISRDVYREAWGDEAVTVLGLYASPDADRVALETALRAASKSKQAVFIRSNRDVQDLSMQIFDRTFVITRVLNWLAAGVAAIALTSALLAWQLERARELAILRSLGLTPWGVAAQIEMQTLFMGLAAFLAAVPAGVLTALVLIEAINRRAFGWQIDFHFALPQFANALGLAVAAAALAGIYPAWRAARAPIAAEMREE